MLRRTTSLALIVLAASSAPLLSARGQERPTRGQPLAPRASEARAVLVEAKAAALRMRDDYQRRQVLDEVGEAEAEAGDLDAALDTAGRAYPYNMATLTAVAERLGDSGDPNQARAVVRKLKGGNASTVYAFMAQRQATNGEISQALRTAELIEAPEVRRDALEWVGRRQAANGDYAEARRTLAAAKAASPDESSYAGRDEMMIVEAQLARGEAQAAHAAVSSLKSAETRAAALLGGAETLRRRGDAEVAAAWLEEALKELPAGPGREFLLYMAMPTQVRLGQKESAMRSAGTLTSEMRLKGYAAVAVTCAELKDLACVNSALKGMKAAASTGEKDEELKLFGMRLLALSVTAALIDNEQSEAASLILADVEQPRDEVSSKMAIEPEVTLQRVLILARRGRFEEARSLALKMRPDSVADTKRGTSLRLLAFLQTQKRGANTARRWASALPGAEDRAYALLGVAQAQLGIGDAKLSYSALNIH
ncbi:MAG: hypothetical protein JOZ96_19990 [Acidobacteria bacterium]|nr:hypothetical protein [Acidobacteriota bacterium]